MLNNLRDDIYYANPGSSLGLCMHRAQKWTYNYPKDPRSRLQNPWLGQGKLVCAFHNLLGQAFKTRGHRDVMQRGMWFHCDISWSILYIVFDDLWIVSSILWIVSDGACGLTDKEAKAVPNIYIYKCECVLYAYIYTYMLVVRFNASILFWRLAFFPNVGPSRGMDPWHGYPEHALVSSYTQWRPWGGGGFFSTGTGRSRGV